MFAVAVSGHTPLPIVILEQQRIIRVDPEAPFTLRRTGSRAFWIGFGQLSLPIIQLSAAQHNTLGGGAIIQSVGE